MSSPVYESCGSQLGNYSHYSKRSQSRNRVLLMPIPGKLGSLSGIPEGPVLLVEDTVNDQTAPFALRRPIEKFYMSSSCDGVELREIIAAVNPKELFFFGPYAKRYVDELKGAAPKIKPLFPNDQPTLF